MPADMLQGVVQTVDGGHTWQVLGGIEGPVGLNWNPSNHQQIVVTAPGDAGISLDGGSSWREVLGPGVHVRGELRHSMRGTHVIRLETPV